MDKEIPVPERRRLRRKRIINIIGIIVLLAVPVIWGLMSIVPAVPAAEIQLCTSEMGPLETTVAATGTVVPSYQEVVTSPVASRIIKAYFRAGDFVTRGQTLLSLDLEATELRLKELEGQYEIASHERSQLALTQKTRRSELEMQTRIKRMELERFAAEVDNERRLDSLGSGTGERVQKAKSDLEVCRLELDHLAVKAANEMANDRLVLEAKDLQIASARRDAAAMRAIMAQGRVPSPIDGVLTYINNEPGLQVAPGERLAVVSDLTSFAIEGEVPEGSASMVQQGAPATIRVGSTELEGMVSSVAPQAKGGMVSFMVSLRPDQDLKALQPGLKTQVYISYGFKDQVLRIRNNTYYKGPGDYELFVAQGPGRLVKRFVTLGASNRQWVEVISGVQPGQQVAISDMKRFESRNEIKIK